MKIRFLVLLGVSALLSCNTPAPRPLELPDLFSDHMVIQQTKEIAFWGTYTPLGKVNVEGSWGTTATAVADESGDWMTDLSTPEAGGPFSIKVITKDKTITIQDVYSGEVWLASGQSNMEMPLTGYLPKEPVDNYEEEIAKAKYPKIREFRVQRSMSLIPELDYTGTWEVCSPETAAKMSATAYFFARKLHQELNVPIGIINSSWGGTPVESWMSRDKLLAINEFEDQLQNIDLDKAKSVKAWFDKFPTSAVPTNGKEWSNLDLGDRAFMDMEYDDSSWKTGSINQLFEDLEGEGTDGAIWFRKKIMIDDVDSDYAFSISGGIDDLDIAYFNGTEIGNTICWNCPRNYTVSKSLLKKGSNVLAVRMIDTGGPGGASGDVTFKSKNGNSIDVIADWRYNRIAGLESTKFLLYHKEPELFNNPPAGLKDQIYNANTPSVLYNAMIYPVIPYTIKGAIWYQGESNVRRAEQYLNLFPAMIQDWRSMWNEEFPFYFVQIAPFGYGNGLSPGLRDAQRKTLAEPSTGMAILMDAGSEPSIHPGNKQVVGARLARLALGYDYGRRIVTSGPIYKSHSVEGNVITISFDHAGSGLISKDSNLTGFEISDTNGTFHAASARIDGNKVIVSLKKVTSPQAVRYGWQDYFEGTLFNKEGIPASSFEEGLPKE